MAASARRCASAKKFSRRMLSELSIRITVAAAVVDLAEVPVVKNGRVKAITISRIARQRSRSRRTFSKVRRLMVRCGTCLTKTRAGNWTLRARVRRTKWTRIGAARAAMPRKNNGVRKDINPAHAESVSYFQPRVAPTLGKCQGKRSYAESVSYFQPWVAPTLGKCQTKRSYAESVSYLHPWVASTLGKCQGKRSYAESVSYLHPWVASTLGKCQGKRSYAESVSYLHPWVASTLGKCQTKRSYAESVSYLHPWVASTLGKCQTKRS